MSRAFGAVIFALALLVIPGVSAQFERPAPAAHLPAGEFGMTAFARLRIEAAAKDDAPIDPPWLLLGYDTLLNLTLKNFGATPTNATFRLTISGASMSPSIVTLHVEPGEEAGALVTVHPTEAGRVTIRAVADDLFQPGGDAVSAEFDAPAVALPSVRMIDPAVPRFVESDEYQSSNGLSAQVASVRVHSGQLLRARVEVHNPLSFAMEGFQVSVETNGAGSFGIAVPVLEPGGTLQLEFPEFVPWPDSGFGGQLFGQGPVFQVQIFTIVTVAGLEYRPRLVEYSLENGVVTNPIAAGFWIQVQDGIAIDILTPKSPTLGVPSRIKFNITNNADTPQKGTVIVSVTTPGGFYYEVQGPEAHSVDVNVAPGQRQVGTIDFTPRITGTWNVFTTFQSGTGYAWGGGGGGINVKGPVTISLAQAGVAYVRINEAVTLDVEISTTKTLQNAQLRVTSGSSQQYYSSRPTSGDYTPGLEQRLLSARTDTANLGTLRPGGVVNATVEVGSRSSGRFDVIPYVLAEGFAYTSTAGDGTNAAAPYSLAVQSRPVATAWALMPFTLALGVFVGTWTLRTKFVK